MFSGSTVWKKWISFGIYNDTTGYHHCIGIRVNERLGILMLSVCKSCDWYFQAWERETKRGTDRERERKSWWVVTSEDERTFSLGVLQRWRRVLPQLCCSCLNSIQDLKRKTQLRWLLTQRALAMVNNSSSLAHIAMLFTLRINKLMLWVCVSAVKWKVDLSPVEYH